MGIIELELEFFFGVFAILLTGAIGLIIRRLFDVYTKKEVNDLIAHHTIKGSNRDGED